MTAYIFPLEAVRKIRRHRLDLCEQLLGYVLGEARKLDAQMSELQSSRDLQLSEIRQGTGEGAVDVDRTASRRFYAGRVSVDIAEVEHHRHIVGQQLELCRHAIVKAEQELKVIDKIEQRRREEFDRQQERKEQFEREEAWQAIRLTTGGT
ncbi:MAG: flagellar FliJ family protein [Planctomycetota bacterium]|nr:flagellar FliJ family protein [Planctomycetota bacterium]